MWITVLLIIIAGSFVLFLLFFAFATSIATQNIPAGHAGIRTGSGGLAVSLSNSMVGSLFLHKIRFLDLHQIYTITCKQTITTQDQQRLLIHYTASYAVKHHEEAIKNLVQKATYKRASDPKKMQAYLQKLLKKQLTKIGQQYNAAQWTDNKYTILEALEQPIRPLGLVIQTTDLTAKT